MIENKKVKTIKRWIRNRRTVFLLSAIKYLLRFAPPQYQAITNPIRVAIDVAILRENVLRKHERRARKSRRNDLGEKQDKGGHKVD